MKICRSWISIGVCIMACLEKDRSRKPGCPRGVQSTCIYIWEDGIASPGWDRLVWVVRQGTCTWRIKKEGKKKEKRGLDGYCAGSKVNGCRGGNLRVLDVTIYSVRIHLREPVPGDSLLFPEFL